MATYSEDVINVMNDMAALAQERASTLKSQSHEADKHQRLLNDFAIYMSRGWHLHILSIADHLSDLPSYLIEKDSHNENVINDAIRIAEGERKDIIRRYPKYLSEACHNAGISLDKDCRHPKYTFNERFFTLEVDERRCIAKLYDRGCRLGEFPADIGAVIESVLKEHERIFNRPLNGEKLLKKLRKHYLAVIKQKKAERGSSILIRQIISRLKKEKGFRLDEFLYDLSRLVSNSSLGVDGYRMELQQTKDTREGLLLHGAAGRGYIGYLVFYEDK